MSADATQSAKLPRAALIPSIKGDEPIPDLFENMQHVRGNKETRNGYFEEPTRIA
jgi:hypothetical protein